MLCSWSHDVLYKLILVFGVCPDEAWAYYWRCTWTWAEKVHQADFASRLRWFSGKARQCKDFCLPFCCTRPLVQEYNQSVRYRIMPYHHITQLLKGLILDVLCKIFNLTSLTLLNLTPDTEALNSTKATKMCLVCYITLKWILPIFIILSFQIGR